MAFPMRSYVATQPLVLFAVSWALALGWLVGAARGAAVMGCFRAFFGHIEQLSVNPFLFGSL